MAPSILFRCDASREIGGGHVMRCLTLADALAARGCAIRFACAAGSAQTVWALGTSGYPLIDLRDPFDASELVAKAGDGHHTLVVDHYGLAAAYERALRGAAAQIMVIDDLADRPHDCDLLVDQNLGRERGAYRGLIPARAVELVGSTYAMVRPEFLQARTAALMRPRSEEPGRRVLISLGLTDVGGNSEHVARALFARCPDVDVDVVIGASAQSRATLETLAIENAGLRVHVETTRITELMSEVDLSIGAAGTTSWERCCLGLPTVLLILADNQREVGRHLHSTGAAVKASDPLSAAIAAQKLLESVSARAEMSKRAAALVDGFGTKRIVDHILGMPQETAPGAL